MSFIDTDQLFSIKIATNSSGRFGNPNALKGKRMPFLLSARGLHRSSLEEILIPRILKVVVVPKHVVHRLPLHLCNRVGLFF